MLEGPDEEASCHYHAALSVPDGPVDQDDIRGGRW